MFDYNILVIKEHPIPKLNTSVLYHFLDSDTYTVSLVLYGEIPKECIGIKPLETIYSAYFNAAIGKYGIRLIREIGTLRLYVEGIKCRIEADTIMNNLLDTYVRLVEMNILIQGTE